MTRSCQCTWLWLFILLPMNSCIPTPQVNIPSPTPSQCPNSTPTSTLSCTSVAWPRSLPWGSFLRPSSSLLLALWCSPKGSCEHHLLTLWEMPLLSSLWLLQGDYQYHKGQEVRWETVGLSKSGDYKLTMENTVGRWLWGLSSIVKWLLWNHEDLSWIPRNHIQ